MSEIVRMYTLTPRVLDILTDRSLYDVVPPRYFKSKAAFYNQFDEVFAGCTGTRFSHKINSDFWTFPREFDKDETQKNAAKKAVLDAIISDLNKANFKPEKKEYILNRLEKILLENRHYQLYYIRNGCKNEQLYREPDKEQGSKVFFSKRQLCGRFAVSDTEGILALIRLNRILHRDDGNFDLSYMFYLCLYLGFFHRLPENYMLARYEDDLADYNKTILNHGLISSEAQCEILALAEQNIVASYHIGELFFYGSADAIGGEHGKPSYSKAFEFYLRASGYGSSAGAVPMAVFSLGWMIYNYGALDGNNNFGRSGEVVAPLERYRGNRIAQVTDATDLMQVALEFKPDLSPARNLLGKIICECDELQDLEEILRDRNIIRPDEESCYQAAERFFSPSEAEREKYIYFDTNRAYLKIAQIFAEHNINKQHQLLSDAIKLFENAAERHNNTFMWNRLGLFFMSGRLRKRHRVVGKYYPDTEENIRVFADYVNLDMAANYFEKAFALNGPGSDWGLFHHITNFADRYPETELLRERVQRLSRLNQDLFARLINEKVLENNYNTTLEMLLR